MGGCVYACVNGACKLLVITMVCVLLLCAMGSGADPGGYPTMGLNADENNKCNKKITQWLTKVLLKASSPDVNKNNIYIS